MFQIYLGESFAKIKSLAEQSLGKPHLSGCVRYRFDVHTRS